MKVKDGILIETFNATVQQKSWGADDDYLVIPLMDIQVFESMGFQDKDRVIVKVEVIKKKEGIE